MPGRKADDMLRREEAFAELVASGVTSAEAYRQAVSDKVKSCTALSVISTKFLRRPNVKARVDELRQHTKDFLKEQFGITMETLLRWHVDVIMTPAGQITADHHLCQKVKRKRFVTGRGEDKEEWETEEIAIPDKTASAEALAKLMGWNKPAELKLSGDALAVAIVQRIERARIVNVNVNEPSKPQ